MTSIWYKNLTSIGVDSWHHKNFHFLPMLDGQFPSTVYIIWCQFNIVLPLGKAPLKWDFDEFGTSDHFPINPPQWPPLISTIHQSWMLVHHVYIYNGYKNHWLVNITIYMEIHVFLDMAFTLYCLRDSNDTCPHQLSESYIGHWCDVPQEIWHGFLYNIYITNYC